MTTESELQQARDERDAAIDRAKMAEEALGILLDDSTIATDAPDAEWQCRFCAGIDGHHVPPCAVQRVIHLLLPPVAPPAPVPPGETTPEPMQATHTKAEENPMNPHQCGEEFWTEDVSWACCTLALGHEGDCCGVVLDNDPGTCGADEDGHIPLGGCVHAAGHSGEHWDGNGPSPSTRRAAPAAHPETTPAAVVWHEEES